MHMGWGQWVKLVEKIVKTKYLRMLLVLWEIVDGRELISEIVEFEIL